MLEPQATEPVVDGVSEDRKIRRGLVGDCPALRQAIDLAERTASGSVPVLIQGEHGTGREALARAIHLAGPRSELPFFALDALEAQEYPPPEPEISLQERLHTRARGGTLFLRSIEGSSRRLQVALAVLLAESSGEHGPRIIASSAADLTELALQGRFEPRLLYALRACAISLPPLRERGDDLVRLVRHFAHQAATWRSRGVCRFSDRALDTLRAYAWPGNVHELRCVVERLTDLADAEVVDVLDLPPMIQWPTLGKRTAFRPLAEVTAEYVAEVFSATGGNVSRAAEILGITRKTLREKLKRAQAGSGGG